jgi:hypothetical protein
MVPSSLQVSTAAALIGGVLGKDGGEHRSPGVLSKEYIPAYSLASG